MESVDSLKATGQNQFFSGQDKSNRASPLRDRPDLFSLK